MKKIFYAGAILGSAALGLIGCSPAANTTGANKLMNANSNTAVVTNSNMNATATNSNAASNMNAAINSNMSSETKKGLSSGDVEFINKASQGNLAEMQMGGLAVAKAKNPELKAFGQKMVTDHSKAHTELRGLAQQKQIELPIGVSVEQMEDRERLSKLSGAAFDKEYVRLMIEDHEKDVADFQKQAKDGSDRDAREYASDTLATLKMHLDMIKAIGGKIK